MSREPVLFEALCTPPPSLGADGLRRVGWVVASFGAVFGLGFWWFGAWPVVGFFGAEVALVLGLLALHSRRTATPPQEVRLVGNSVRVDHTTLVAYWTRADLLNTPRGGTRLVLRDLTHSVEIGAALAEPARRELAQAVRAALADYRTPRFRNPRL